jgi:site-specific recombinase XerD
MSRVFHRNGAWWIDFKDTQGVRRRRKIGPSKRVAQEVLDGYLGKVARRQHLGVIEDSPVAFAEFVDKVWWERIQHGLRPRSQERWKGIVEKHLKPAFSGTLRSITSAAVEAYIARRLAPVPCPACAGKDANCTRCAGIGKLPGAKPATVNREVNVLKHILRRAVAWEYLGRNPLLDTQGQPLQGLKPLREPSGRVRFLTPDEVDQLLASCQRVPYLHAFTLVALNTGMRRNEILGLTRSSIDTQNRIATLEVTKNGETRRVPLNQAAFEALASLPARMDGRLFPLGPNQTTMAFRRAVKRAGIEGFRLHDARHTFASYQAMAGVQGRALQALLGHKDPRMTMRYSHLSDAYLRAAVERVELGATVPTSRQRTAKAKKVGTYLAPTASASRRGAPK